MGQRHGTDVGLPAEARQLETDLFGSRPRPTASQKAHDRASAAREREREGCTAVARSPEGQSSERPGEPPDRALIDALSARLSNVTTS